MTLQVFALTGGMGSGKSTVAARFAARGLPVVDADELSRAVVERGSVALGELVAAFGSEILTAEGSLNRRGLARRVFSDEAARRTLESITHPRIRLLSQQRFQKLEERGEPLACYEVPLLFEAGLQSEFHPIVVVAVPENMQVDRATRRDSTPKAHIEARIRAQLPLSEKARRADYVIDNSGPLAQTLLQADQVLDAICASSGIEPSRYAAPA